MNGKRLAFATLVVAVVVAAAGGATNSISQTQDAPGISYGGLKDKYAAWLRLDLTRRSIAALQMDWAIARERCSNRKPYSSTLYAGYEELRTVRVSQDGKFKRTVVDRYSEEGTRYEENQTVEGTIKNDVATGSISGRVRIVKPNGKVVRCNFGPQRWTLVD
jgi:hypothetical protein